MIEAVTFAVGGPVQGKQGTYLRRPADEALFQACQEGEFAYVLACRQIGKSSLMYATVDRLRQEEIRTAIVDLNEIGKGAHRDQWYFSLMGLLNRELDLQANVEAWWNEKSSLSSLAQRFVLFFREAVLGQISERIVVFIDEIDMTLGLSFTDDFYGAIRTIYSERAHYAEYQRLTFVLLGVATPDELIQDRDRTPFNIGRRITISDFTKEECDLFRLELEARHPGRGNNYFNQIYDWTNGYPYLTQKLCAEIAKSPEKDDLELVERIVQRLFLAPEARGESNFHSVQDKVIHDPRAKEMLKVYKNVLQGEPVPDDEQSLLNNRLKLYGLVSVQNGRLQTRNKIYSQVFNAAWTDDMMTQVVSKGIPKPYTVQQIIGEGGFTTVYLAQAKIDSETKLVALKVLDLIEAPNYDWTTAIAQFEREQATITKLNHPNIVKIFHTGQTERPDKKGIFIAMEYIPGGTLKGRLEKDKFLPRQEAVSIIKQIGDALGLVHANGIVHCDVKPNNILVDTEKEPARAVLTDFGVSRLLTEDCQANTSRGTYEYMAPEQWQHKKVTVATDIYALAITFFEMVAGRHPFKGGVEATWKEQHLRQPFPRLSSIVSGVGPFFDDVLIKAAAKNSADRYQTMGEFINEIEAANERAIAQEKRFRAARTLERARDSVQYAEQIRLSPPEERESALDDALKDIELALRIFPGYVDALALKGQIELGKGNFSDALETYKQAYEQECNPASQVGKEYLAILKRLASEEWQKGEYQAAIKQYETIQHILNQGHEAKLSIEVWQEARNELIRAHWQEGEAAYALGYPQNPEQAMREIDRQIQALEAFGDYDSSHILQRRKEILQINFHYEEGKKAYAKGSPDDIVQAIQVLEQKLNLLEGLKASLERNDLQGKLNELKIKRYVSEGEKAYIDGDIGALRNRIQDLEVLGATEQSRTLQTKLNKLQIKHHYEAGKKAYSESHPGNIVEVIQVLRSELQALETLGAVDAIQDLGKMLHKLEIERYQAEGEKACAQVDPDNLGEAIKTLARVVEELEKINAVSESQTWKEKLVGLQIQDYLDKGRKAYAERNFQDLEVAIKSLDGLGATQKSYELKDGQRQLQIQTQKDIIEAEWNVIAEVDTQDDEARFCDEGVFQHYFRIDQAYQKLMELAPQDPQWKEGRRANAKEETKRRSMFTDHLLGGDVPDYKAAVRHYQRIQDIEQAEKGIVQELKLGDPQQRIQDWEEKAGYEAEYQEVMRLAENRKYREAIDHLRQEFLFQGKNYEYRDVPRLLWKLVYAKQNNSERLPEWDYEAIRKQLKAKSEETDIAKKELNEKKWQYWVGAGFFLTPLVAAAIIAPQLADLPWASKVIVASSLAVYLGYYVWAYVYPWLCKAVKKQ